MKINQRQVMVVLISLGAMATGFAKESLGSMTMTGTATGLHYGSAVASGEALAWVHTRPTERTAAEVAATTRSVNGPTFAAQELDRKPVAVFQARPVFPAELRKAGTDGAVIVEFVVDQNGDVCEPSAVKWTEEAFAKSAVAAVKQWKFKAGEKSGLPVNTRLAVPVRFINQG